MRLPTIRFWEMGNEQPEPVGMYPTLDEYAVALAEVARMEAVSEQARQERIRCEVAAEYRRMEQQDANERARRSFRQDHPGLGDPVSNPGPRYWATTTWLTSGS